MGYITNFVYTVFLPVRVGIRDECIYLIISYIMVVTKTNGVWGNILLQVFSFLCIPF